MEGTFPFVIRISDEAWRKIIAEGHAREISRSAHYAFEEADSRASAGRPYDSLTTTVERKLGVLLEYGLQDLDDPEEKLDILLSCAMPNLLTVEQTKQLISELFEALAELEKIDRIYWLSEVKTVVSQCEAWKYMRPVDMHKALTFLSERSMWAIAASLLPIGRPSAIKVPALTPEYVKYIGEIVKLETKKYGCAKVAAALNDNFILELSDPINWDPSTTDEEIEELTSNFCSIFMDDADKESLFNTISLEGCEQFMRLLDQAMYEKADPVDETYRSLIEDVVLRILNGEPVLPSREIPDRIPTSILKLIEKHGFTGIRGWHEALLRLNLVEYDSNKRPAQPTQLLERVIKEAKAFKNYVVLAALGSCVSQFGRSVLHSSPVIAPTEAFVDYPEHIVDGSLFIKVASNNWNTEKKAIEYAVKKGKGPLAMQRVPVKYKAMYQLLTDKKHEVDLTSEHAWIACDLLEVDKAVWSQKPLSFWIAALSLAKTYSQNNTKYTWDSIRKLAESL